MQDRSPVFLCPFSMRRQLHSSAPLQLFLILLIGNIRIQKQASMHGWGFRRLHIIPIFLFQPSIIACRGRNPAVFKGKIHHFIKPLALPGIFFQMADKYRIADPCGIRTIKPPADCFIKETARSIGIERKAPSLFKILPNTVAFS